MKKPLILAQSEPPYTLTDGEVTVYVNGPREKAQAMCKRLEALYNDVLTVPDESITQGFIGMVVEAA